MSKFLFLKLPKIHFLGRAVLTYDGIAGRGSGTFTVLSVTDELLWSQSYLQYGWKFQLCWNVAYCLILVTWEPLPRTTFQSTEEEDRTDSLHPPGEVFLENLENFGDISLGGQKTWRDTWKCLKELRWESKDLLLLHWRLDTVLPHEAQFFNTRRVVIIVVVFSFLLRNSQLLCTVLFCI